MKIQCNKCQITTEFHDSDSLEHSFDGRGISLIDWPGAIKFFWGHLELCHGFTDGKPPTRKEFNAGFNLGGVR